jgi:hypothetical protein
MRITLCQLLMLLIHSVNSCHSQSLRNAEDARMSPAGKNVLKNIILNDTTIKSIHILVALCDNKYQGIVPVPEKIGNGQDADNNLYWGCAFGVRTFFKKSNEWTLIETIKPGKTILERLVFKHKTKNYYLVADAYDGKLIRKCTEDFLYSCSGELKDTIKSKNKIIGINGNASLLSYIGHDGLMDFELDDSFENFDEGKRDCIILACISRKYFTAHLKPTSTYPLLWTTGLMCPEAYTLHDAIGSYINNQSPEYIRNKAADAYAKYQKCSQKAARALLVTGW